MGKFFSGEVLYGNDFNRAEIEGWFADEAEGYAELGSSDRSKYVYSYHALNIRHGYSKFSLPKESYVLAFGAAYGDELTPVAEKIGKAVIIDPSEAFTAVDTPVKDTKWVKPNVSGEIDFPSNTFDLVTCLGVLHHIPNVEFVVKEIHRVLKKNGVLMLREPIVSMGDWRRPRKGLTRRERGIPIGVFRRLIADTGFQVESEKFCIFSPLQRMARMAGVSKPLYNSQFLTLADSYLSFLSKSRANAYHRETAMAKIAPSSVFYVLRK